MPAVISDSSPLIYLSKLERFDLLRSLYGSLVVPKAVWDEIVLGGTGLPEAENLRRAKDQGWVRIESAGPIPAAAATRLLTLDPGEVEAICLALQLRLILLIDEADGRAAAEALGVEVTGTVGVLARAKRHGILPTLRGELDRLRAETSFRISWDLYRAALESVGETAGDPGLD